MASSRLYWHVPEWNSDNFAGLGAGVGNTNGDIVIPLINSDFADPGDPRQDNFVVERIIGQYLLNAGATAEAGSRIIHNRVYVADSDASSIALRSLNTADDADSSFLYHQVTHFDSGAIGKQYGSWQNGGVNEVRGPVGAVNRYGHFDIKVGRRVNEGETLIWHTQISTVNLEDDTWAIQMWVRVLMREGK